MLETWIISNFKSIRERTELKLGALTVLAGANSSGKSTFLQSILLTTQTLANPVDSRLIVLNGRILRLGNMNEVVHRGSGHGEITFGFTYNAIRPSYWPKANQPRSARGRDLVDDEIQSLSCQYTFAADNTASTREQGQLQPIVTSCTLAVLDTDGDESNLTVTRSEMQPEVRAEGLKLELALLNREERDSLKYIVLSSDINKFSSTRSLYLSDEGYAGPVVGARLTHFLPTALMFRLDVVMMRANSVVSALTSSLLTRGMGETSLPPDFVSIILDEAQKVLEKGDAFPARKTHIKSMCEQLVAEPTLMQAVDLIRSGGPSFRESIKSRRSDLMKTLTVNQVPTYVVDASPVRVGSTIRSLLFDNLRYLGPLRDEPKHVYPLEGAADPTDVGLKGEFTAAVLTSHRETRVSYITPHSWASLRTKAKLENSNLRKAVLEWLQYLEVVSDIEASDRGVLGHDLRVSIEKDEALHSLVHVGVGVSQVLPILVMALIAKPDSILIFEQPELHLHPKVQTRLADFLFSITMSGKQCIVETHSEYMINRLRLRAAEDETDTLAKMFVMYHVAKSNGASRYERITINEFGAVPDWPEGFFDQAPREAESILRAALKKREARRKGRS